MQTFSASLVTLHRQVLATLILLLCACSPSGSSAGSSSSSETTQPLTIIGFNYTDRYIDSFEVDGQGGGNLDVSTPSAGGGKGTCCIGWRPGTPLPQKVHVKWAVGGCVQTLTSSTGYVHRAIRHRFKEVEAELLGPIPPNPGYFETHFYPAGHVEVAVTAAVSSPRLSLSPSREKAANDQHCEEEK